MVAPFEKQDSGEQPVSLSKLLREYGVEGPTFIAVCLATGMSGDVICEVFDILPEELEGYKSSPRIANMCNQLQIALGMTAERRLAAAMHLALDTKMTLLRTGDNKIKNAVSTEVLDRNLGKPVQTTQSFNANVNVSATPEELDKRLLQTDKRIALLEEKRSKLLGSL